MGAFREKDGNLHPDAFFSRILPHLDLFFFHLILHISHLIYHHG